MTFSYKVTTSLFMALAIGSSIFSSDNGMSTPPPTKRTIAHATPETKRILKTAFKVRKGAFRIEKQDKSGSLNIDEFNDFLVNDVEFTKILSEKGKADFLMKTFVIDEAQANTVVADLHLVKTPLSTAEKKVLANQAANTSARPNNSSKLSSNVSVNNIPDTSSSASDSTNQKEKTGKIDAKSVNKTISEKRSSRLWVALGLVGAGIAIYAYNNSHNNSSTEVA